MPKDSRGVSFKVSPRGGGLSPKNPSRLVWFWGVQGPFLPAASDVLDGDP
jgi:hypothetical protein